jgi:ribulose bisphosphate carboxylase small subunit
MPPSNWDKAVVQGAVIALQEIVRRPDLNHTETAQQVQAVLVREFDLDLEHVQTIANDPDILKD